MDAYLDAEGGLVTVDPLGPQVAKQRKRVDSMDSLSDMGMPLENNV